MRPKTLTNKLFALLLISTLGLLFCTSPENSKRELPESAVLTKADTILTIANRNIDKNYLDEAILKLDYAVGLESSLRTKGEIFAALGYCYIKKEEYRFALENYLSAINYFDQLKDKGRLAQMQLNSATCFKLIGLYDKAAKNAFLAQNYFLKDSTKRKELALVYNLIGNIFKQAGSYDAAAKYYGQSLSIRRTINGFSLLGPINNLGNNYFQQGALDSALTYFQRSRLIGISNGDKKSLGIAHYNLCKTYLQLKNSKLTQYHLDSAKRIYAEVGYKKGIVALSFLESEFYVNDKSYSEKRLIFALNESKKLSLYEEHLKSLKKLSEFYLVNNRLRESITYSIKYQEFKEKVDKEDKSNKIMSYEMLSELDKKNEEIQQIAAAKKRSDEESQKRGQQRNFLILLVMLALSVSYIFFKRYQEKKRFVDEYFASDKGVILKSGKKVSFDDIIRVETIRNDLILITENGRIVEKNTTLKSFLPSLPKITFGRPQRGIVVNFNKLDKVLKTKLEVNNEAINISPTYKEEFLAGWAAFSGEGKDI